MLILQRFYPDLLCFQEWKCHSLYWPGEAFDIQRGTWFQEITWQPLQCEYADRIEQEHLNHFRLADRLSLQLSPGVMGV